MGYCLRIVLLVLHLGWLGLVINYKFMLIISGRLIVDQYRISVNFKGYILCLCHEA